MGYQYRAGASTAEGLSAPGISITTVEREKEKGKISKELISRHKIIRTIKNKKTIYCSPGHFLKFNTYMTKQKKNLMKFLQIAKSSYLLYQELLLQLAQINIFQVFLKIMTKSYQKVLKKFFVSL